MKLYFLLAAATILGLFLAGVAVISWVMAGFRDNGARPGDASYGDPEYMCPNCVTPWKCNGPHIPEDRLARVLALRRLEYDGEAVGV